MWASFPQDHILRVYGSSYNQNLCKWFLCFSLVTFRFPFPQLPSVVVRLEIFPDHVQALSLEKLVWIQQSKDIVYMIGQVSEPCVEFVVELAVIEHSNSFLAGHLRMLLPSTNINDAQGQNEIYITLNLNPHFFP